MTTPIRTLPRPRGYIESATLAVAFLIPVSALICLLVMVVNGMPLDGILIGVFSLHCGLIFGLIMGYFYQLRKTTIEFLDPAEFLRYLDAELLRLRYRPVERNEHFTMYKSKWYTSRGRFFVRMFEDCATLVGPKYFVDKLTRKLEREQEGTVAVEQPAIL